jgi:hypothetical protein
MPLCWAHAEYLCLVRSRADGVPFDRVAPAYERYVNQRTARTSKCGPSGIGCGASRAAKYCA